jgi:membrane associated rhomboid family serine protease
LFLPLRGFMGFVYLPAWVALVLWAVGDVAGYLGTLPELGGIAHTAHLGGEAAGLLVGLILWSLRRRRAPASADAPVTEASTLAAVKACRPMGVLIPFLPPKPRRAA